MRKLLFIAVFALLIDCVLWLVRAAWVSVMTELHPGPLVMGLAVAFLFFLVAVKIGFRLAGRLRERWGFGRVSAAELLAVVFAAAAATYHLYPTIL